MSGRSRSTESPGEEPMASHRRLVNYYALLGVPQSAGRDEISGAYLERVNTADEALSARLERAMEVLTDPARRRMYDQKLAAQGSYSRAQVQPESGSQNRTLQVSWIGGLAFLILLVAVGWWMLNAAGGRGTPGGVASGSGPESGAGSSEFRGAGGETQAQLEQEAVVAQTGADGKQTVDVVLNSATFQYEPKVIKVKQGVPVQINLSTKNGDPG